MFSFGRYSICLEGVPDQVGVLLRSWRSFENPHVHKPEECDVVLHIAESDLISGFRIRAGWTSQSFNGKQQALYSDGNRTRFGLQYDFQSRDVTISVNDTNLNDIRLGLQFGLLIALHNECVGLHGVTMLCGHEAIILTAPSGTGKTTLSHLLEQNSDAVTINGDFALLRPTKEGIVFEPTPFCGTSGRALNYRIPVHRIVFLSQAEDNKWKPLTGRQAMIRCLDNAFIPVWDSCLLQPIRDNLMRIVSLVNVTTFAFAPAKEAALVFLENQQQEETIKE